MELLNKVVIYWGIWLYINKANSPDVYAVMQISQSLFVSSQRDEQINLDFLAMTILEKIDTSSWPHVYYLLAWDTKWQQLVTNIAEPTTRMQSLLCFVADKILFYVSVSRIGVQIPCLLDMINIMYRIHTVERTS